jgi:hypothetical protein
VGPNRHPTSTLGGNLPSKPDAKSLEDFLKQQRRVNPDHFHDLSLSIIKLLGRGEYVLKSPGQQSPGHFFSGTTLFTFHGAEQAISRFDNTTSSERGAGRQSRGLCRRGTGEPRGALYAEGGRCE